jgi:hypothetical protein
MTFVPRAFIDAASNDAHVVGVIGGTGASVNGTFKILAPSQPLPIGTKVQTAAGTTVLLSQDWDTKQGHCTYWTIINGASQVIRDPGTGCHPINKDLSLSTAIAKPGVTIIADIRSVQGYSVTTGGGSVGSSSQAVTSEPLKDRLDRELKAFLRAHPAPSGPSRRRIDISSAPLGPSASDLCREGLVWREAIPSDHVCVTPDTRQATARDNQTALARRNPKGGDFGPDTCLVPFVWRDAFPNDHVCVTQDTRRQAQSDNEAAAANRAR